MQERRCQSRRQDQPGPQSVAGTRARQPIRQALAHERQVALGPLQTRIVTQRQAIRADGATWFLRQQGRVAPVGQQLRAVTVRARELSKLRFGLRKTG